MRRIVLCCNGGMSTSLLMNKMIEAAKEQEYECEITAHSSTEIGNVVQEADILLLGPQIGYQKNKIVSDFPNVLVNVIDMRTYGMMDGKKVLESAKKALGDE